MERKLCLMHANCQGDELERLLLSSAAFCRAYVLVRRTNYTREAFSQEELNACSVFLYQRLGESWGDLASDVLLAKLPPSAVSLRIPNMFFKGYWPFWTRNSPIEEFGDSLLDRLIDEGAPKPAILRIYLRTDIQAYINLKESLEETIAIERDKEKDAPVKTVDYLLTHWKERQVFHSNNHPDRSLLVLAAQSIFTALDLPGFSADELAGIDRLENFPSYANFDHPIHPQVAAFHGLTFAGPDTEFNVFGRPMTFERFISRYIDCRQNKMDDGFLGFMQLV